MSSIHEPTLTEGPEAVFAAIVASLPGHADTEGPLGLWRVTTQSQEGAEHYWAVLGPDGQYVQTADMVKFGFGCWSASPEHSLVIAFEEPLSPRVGVARIRVGALINSAATFYSGAAEWTEFDLSGALATGTATLQAERIPALV